jgi:hypothetical protein
MLVDFTIEQYIIKLLNLCYYIIFYFLNMLNTIYFKINNIIKYNFKMYD